MRNLNQNPLLALLAATALLFSATAATAQGEGQTQAPMADAPAVDVSDQDVEKFADAYVAVQTINQEYSAKLQNVEETEKATELQQEARTKMQEAVTQSGLSITDYQEIAQQANQDEQLRTDIQEAVAALIEPEAAQGDAAQ